jgi:hypothetical protein
MNHGLNMNQIVSHRNKYSHMNHRFCENVLFEFMLSTLQSNRNILSPEQVIVPAVSILKIANIHVGTR